MRVKCSSGATRPNPTPHARPAPLCCDTSERESFFYLLGYCIHPKVVSCERRNGPLGLVSVSSSVRCHAAPEWHGMAFIYFRALTLGNMYKHNRGQGVNEPRTSLRARCVLGGLSAMRHWSPFARNTVVVLSVFASLAFSFILSVFVYSNIIFFLFVATGMGVSSSRDGGKKKNYLHLYSYGIYFSFIVLMKLFVLLSLPLLSSPSPSSSFLFF